MKSSPLTIALATGLTVGAAWLAIERHPARAAALPSDDKTLIHVLSRAGFGPRPGDLERVRELGLQAYIDQQLHPERIPDGPMEARLAGFPTLRMSSRELAEQYERPAIEARRRRQAANGGNPVNPVNPVNPQVQGNPGASGPMPDPAQQRGNRPLVELSGQKVLRAAYSDRQLQEVLTDFWFNHFNIDARKGPDRFLLTAYERDTIRPRVLGKFRDLLGATAKSPAMLFYLDNWMSTDPNGPHATARQMQRPGFGRGGSERGGLVSPGMPGQPPNAQRNMPRGLNENYGRELMELHTLGVDGGYTQKDVTEVARAFTGWTIRMPRLGGDFTFDERIHDPGQKVVLGHVIKSGGGEEDGERVLDILANHPATARFIATKLARRFVSDTPPPALVDRMAARFRETDGDLREVMRTLLTSAEFLSPDAYRAKVKTPFEFVVSAVRVTGTDVPDPTPFVRAAQQLGMPLYMCQPPTGYRDTADAWVNTGALVSRMNFALQLTSGRMPGATSDSRQSAVGSQQSPVGSQQSAAGSQDIVRIALNDDISDATRSTIAKAMTPQQMAALTLGSPEFQRR